MPVDVQCWSRFNEILKKNISLHSFHLGCPVFFLCAFFLDFFTLYALLFSHKEMVLKKYKSIYFLYFLPSKKENFLYLMSNVQNSKAEKVIKCAATNRFICMRSIAQPAPMNYWNSWSKRPFFFILHLLLLSRTLSCMWYVQKTITTMTTLKSSDVFMPASTR